MIDFDLLEDARGEERIDDGDGDLSAFVVAGH
jgi:hypothetical protein